MDDRAAPPPQEDQTAGRRRRVGRLLFLSAVVAAVVVATIAAGGFWLFQRAFDAPGPLAADSVMVIPRGASVRAIAGQLAAGGVVGDATLFAFGVRAFGGQQPLIAGEYSFPAGVSARGAMAILQSGKVVVHNLTVPEGLTVAQVLVLVADAEALTGAPPDAGAIGEGTLLPETYHYVRGDLRADMVARMGAALSETLDELWRSRSADAEPLGTPREALILASIVERETALASERPRIAAVFLNRLRRGMRLQSDPTVVYGLSHGSGSLGRPLTYADLAVDHPYNTYIHAGLPPGPIANPGRASLAAVVQPAKTNDLYFVADGSGGHAFAATLEEHNRNVARWRKFQRQNGNR